LSGSKGISMNDAKFSKSPIRMPEHYRVWQARVDSADLIPEVYLWSDNKIIEMIIDCIDGKFSSNRQLAAEKLLYEISKRIQRNCKNWKKKKIENLQRKLKIAKLEIRGLRSVN